VATTGIPKGNTYDKYASTNPIEQRLMSGFFACLDELLPVAAPEVVLEVGLGEGEVSERLRHRYPDASIMGIDLPDRELATAWKEKGLVGAFADVAHLPFPDNSVDLILAIEVLEHVADPEQALREIARVGRGPVLLSVPREPIWRIANLVRGKYVTDLGNTPGHIQHWSRRSFSSMVRRHLDTVAVKAPLPWTVVSARVA
jgi:ubiquinone/menaquinone biosynthesis C-methylase UbiE